MENIEILIGSENIYLVSQLITIIYYAVLCFTFMLKDRSKILVLNFIAHIGQTTAMYMLGGYTGASMAFIMMLRDLIFWIQEKRKYKSSEDNKKVDIIVLIITIILILTLTIFTYNGVLSLLSVVAAFITTISLWQKDVKKYKLLGIFSGILWLAYNIYIMSIMGIILESILEICSIIGYIKDVKRENIKNIIKHENM